MAITNGYATLAEIKAALRISDSVDDALLEPAVESASRLIDGHCGRAFWNAGTVTRDYVPNDNYLCEIDDLQGTAVTIRTSSGADLTFDQTWSTTDYQLEPLNGVTAGQATPFYKIRAIDGEYVFPKEFGAATVRVTGAMGWSYVPSAVKQATIIQAARIFKRLDSPLGVAGFGDLGIMRVGRGLDTDVAQLVAAYVKYPHGIA